MSLPRSLRDEVHYRVRYKGYLEREIRQVGKLSNIERISIPDSFSFKTVKGLRIESMQKLEKHRPETLAQASRISGVSPADISLLMVALSARHA
jgi:tRNA uridine 5-carboxymethylaminomethyl modification enzyme